MAPSVGECKKYISRLLRGSGFYRFNKEEKQLNMENGKALHSGKNAEKRRSEAIRRELLVLVHDFLTEEGLFEAADAMRDQMEPLLSQYKVADNIDLPLIAAEFLAYYRLRFHREPLLVRKCEGIQAKQVQRLQQQNNKRSTPLNKKKREKEEDEKEDITRASQVDQDPRHVLLGNTKLRQLKMPRGISEEEKELYGLISRDVLQDGGDDNKDRIGFIDVVGQPKAKEALEDALLLPLQHPDIYKDQVCKKSALLLAGPPGTGKTMLAKALHFQSPDVLFFNVHSSSLASKWRGDSEKLVRVLFDLAHHNAPAVIFIDEIEAILSERGCQGEHEASKRAKAEFLVHLDGIRNQHTNVEEPVLFLASTNLPWTLDPAIIRRFQKVIPVDLPNASERLSILQKCLEGHDVSQLDLKALASSVHSEDFSGSDISRSCTNAINLLLRRKVADRNATPKTKNARNNNEDNRIITMKDMTESFKLVKPMNRLWRKKYDEWSKML